MSRYRLAIADDDLVSTRSTYEHLFENAPDFKDRDYIATVNDFRAAPLERYDALLLDVNLDGWEISLGDAVSIVKGRCPVVLVSQYMGEKNIHDNIRNVMALAKTTHFVQLLILNDLACAGWEKRVFATLQQLRLAIAQHQRQGALDLGGNESIHILHLSDPQYGDAGQDSWACLAESEVANYVRDRLEPRIDFVAVTGDITFSGKPSQFKTAEERLGFLLTCFFPNRDDWRERLLLVPGNHDVDIELTAADLLRYQFSNRGLKQRKSNDVTREHQRYGLQPFRDFAGRLTGDPAWQAQDGLCWYSDSFRHLGLRFFMLNSVGALDYSSPASAEWPEGAMRGLSQAVFATDRLFGLALSHHGPAEVGAPEPKDGHVEAISNWPVASKTIQECKIHLLLHGHGHTRLAEKLMLGSACTHAPEGRLRSDEVIRVMAPTTHLGEKKRPDKSYRGFNLITLKRSQSVVTRVSVNTYKLDDTGPTRVAEAYEVDV